MMEEDAFDINAHGASALWFALGMLNEPIDEDAVKLVLGLPGLNIHLTGPEGQTVLWAQCNMGKSRNVELLLVDGRIDPNQRTTDTGSSPLYTAANQGRVLCVKLLLADPRVDPNLADLQGYTPLISAADQGRDGCVALFLADGRIDPNRSTDKGRSPLGVAANQGRDLCVKLLLADPRVDPNLACLKGVTPLNTASNQSRDGCVELLLADGRVDVHLACADGDTPLVSACYQLAKTFDQVGAPEPPTRCLVLLLKSRRISDYYMKESIALLRRHCMPTRRRIATAEAGGKPLHPHQKMARLIMPVLEAELRGEHRWCTWCHKLTPDRDLDKCARCNEVSYLMQRQSM
jgi:hypothetical protein